MPSLLRDGEWELIQRNDEYHAIHKCPVGAFSWEEGPQWVATKRLSNECMACGETAPKAMQGFVNMLEWEP